MKASTLVSLFLLACLMVVSAMADGNTAAPGGTADSTEDDIQTLFRGINANGGLLGEQQMAGIRQACNGHRGLKKLEINIDIKLVLVKINDRLYRA